MQFDTTLPHRRYFQDICAIPHGSGNEKALSDYLAAFAKERGLEYLQDEMFNVIIRKPASAGMQNVPTLTLQAHMDMVCEKNNDTVHDFEKDPISLVVGEDGFLRARGTTLGADDGSGVAYMLAILEDNDLVHGPLECIFTVSEETGMFGALALKAEDIKGRRLICLDGGGETTTLTTTCSGCRAVIEKKMAVEENSRPCFRIAIRGLMGGHSGGEIHKERGSANHLMVRILDALLEQGIDIRLCSISGGSKENAITRECDAVFASEADFAEMNRYFEDIAGKIKAELAFSDNGFRASLEPTEKEVRCFSLNDSRDAVSMLFLCPWGLQARSMAVEGLTMNSLNMGVLQSDCRGIRAAFSIRSMLESPIDEMVRKLQLLAGAFGAELTRGAQYPGWDFRPVSPLRELFSQAVRDRYHQEPVFKAVHGGTECGVFCKLHPDMDIITMGPISNNAHSPQEELDLASFDRTYLLLQDIVSRCCQAGGHDCA